MSYTLEEQEVLFHYDALTKEWSVETNMWNMIKRYEPMLKPETIKKEVVDGKTLSIRGILDSDKFKISVGKRPPKREYTEEEKQALRDRIAKMHEAKRVKAEK